MGRKIYDNSRCNHLKQGTFAMNGLNGGLVIQWNLVLVAAILGFFIG